MWRAVGLCLVGAALGLYGAVGIAFVQPPSEPVTSRVYEYPGQQGYDAEPAPMPALPDEAEASADAWDYQRPCDQPETGEQADLCQQWRMAKASENLVGWARRQFRATVIEASLLAVTVIFTVVAATAAVCAARAAQASVNVATEIGKRQLRAYVSVTKVEAILRDMGNDIEVCTIIVLTNSGQTPATLMNLDIEVKTGSRGGGVRTIDFEYREIGARTPWETREYSSVGRKSFGLVQDRTRKRGTMTVTIRFRYQDYLGKEWAKSVLFSGIAWFDDSSKEAVIVAFNQLGDVEPDDIAN